MSIKISFAKKHFSLETPTSEDFVPSVGDVSSLLVLSQKSSWEVKIWTYFLKYSMHLWHLHAQSKKVVNSLMWNLYRVDNFTVLVNKRISCWLYPLLNTFQFHVVGCCKLHVYLNVLVTAKCIIEIKLLFCAVVLYCIVNPVKGSFHFWWH